MIDSGKTVHLIGGCDVAMELTHDGQLPREHGWRWRFKSLLKRRMQRIRHVALINKQGGRMPNRVANFLACSSVNFLFPLKRVTPSIYCQFPEDRKGLNQLIHKGTNHSYTARHGLRHGINSANSGADSSHAVILAHTRPARGFQDR